MLKYIELKTGYSDNGPAWIAHVQQSRTGRTLYFNGRALGKIAGRASNGGNYIDIESREAFWVSGVKRNGRDRHWAGGGVVLVERGAVADYLNVIGATSLDSSRHRVTDDIVATDVSKFVRLENERLR